MSVIDEPDLLDEDPPACACEGARNDMVTGALGTTFSPTIFRTTLATALGFESPADVADSMILAATRQRTRRLAELESRFRDARHHFEALAEQLAHGDVAGALMRVREVLHPIERPSGSGARGIP